MTDERQEQDIPRTEAPLTCADVRQLLPAYERGMLTEVIACAIEQHAADCSACEPLLTGAIALHRDVDLSSAVTAAVPLDGATAHMLRSATLARVAGSRRARTRGWMSWAAGSLLAASLLLYVVGREAPVDGEVARTVPSATADSLAVEFPGATSAPMRSAVRLAQTEAAPEFAALDTAMRELDAAIEAKPGDDVLRAFRQLLESRRLELELRVARVTE